MPEQQKELIKSFIADVKKRDAVKDYILERLGSNEWLLGVDTELGDKEFGNMVKTKSCAILMLRDAFRDMELLSKDPVEDKKHKPRI